jgi:redox-sensitive bicupin YhaK (pirin superfamily)
MLVVATARRMNRKPVSFCRQCRFDSKATHPIQPNSRRRGRASAARVLGNTSEFDPFLLLDDFRNDVPEDYLAGFPWHPRRGIETITYVLAGTVEHGDSMGNHGAIASGDVQWMMAGSGIIHQEMPKGDQPGRMHGFQVWANLPAALKMTSPRYQEVKWPDIPEVKDDDGTHVRIVCGNFWGKKGRWTASLPIQFIWMCRLLLDAKSLPVETTRHAFAYVFAGAGSSVTLLARCVPTESAEWSDTHPPSEADNRSLVLFDRGDEVTVQAEMRGFASCSSPESHWKSQ